MANNSSTLEQIDAEIRRRRRSANTQSEMLRAIDAEIERRRTSDQQRQQVARQAGERHLNRAMTPMGLGAIAQPFVNTITDPDRRAQVGESFQGFVRDVQQLPRLDYGRLARDTGAAVAQGVRDLPQAAGRIVQNLPQIARAATYGPFQDEERAQQQLDLARVQGDRSAMQTAAREANAQTGMAGINIAAPLALGGSPSVLRAAGVSAAATAPMALGGPGSLQERLPSGLATIAGAATLGGGLQGLANVAPGVAATQPRSGTMARAGAFRRQGVRPTMAAVNGGPIETGATQIIRENLVAGPRVRQHINNSIRDTRDAVARVRDQYGAAQSPEGAGRTVQEAVRRWASEDVPRPAGATRNSQVSTQGWSFDSKSNAIYDHVLGQLAAAEDAMLAGRATVGGRRMIGNGAPGATLTTADNAQAALRDVLGSVRNPAFRETIQDPQLSRYAQMLETPDRIHFTDLRAFRTYVRNLQRKPQLRQGVDDAGLARLEGALTQDIYASAERIGGARAVQALRRADQMYRAGNETLRTVLREFDPTVGANGSNPSSAFERILARARPGGGRANAEVLLSLKRRLRPDESQSLAASLIDYMGEPAPGRAGFTREIGFDIERWATRWNNISPEARKILFGSRGGGSNDALLSALDDLATIANAQKGIEEMANRSRSGSVGQNVASAALVFNPNTWAWGIGLLAAGAAFGEAMANPAFVRWITSAPAAGQRFGGVRRHLVLLSQLAAADPAVAAVAAEIARTADQQSPAGPASSGGLEALPRAGRQGRQ